MSSKLMSSKVNKYFNNDVVKRYFDDVEWIGLEKDEKEEMLFILFEKIFIDFRFIVCNIEMYDVTYNYLMHDLYDFLKKCKKKEIWENVLKKCKVDLSNDLNELTLNYFDNYWVNDKKIRKEIIFNRAFQYFNEKIDNKKIENLLETYIINNF